MASASQNKAALKAQIRAADQKIDELLDKLVEVESTTVIKAYEKKIDKLERDRLVLEERAANSGASTKTFDKMFELASLVLSKLCKIWASGRIDLQRLVLNLAFNDRTVIAPELEFSKPKFGLTFQGFSGVFGQ